MDSDKLKAINHNQLHFLTIGNYKHMDIKIIAARDASEQLKDSAAMIILAAFRHISAPWTDIKSAQAEINSMQESGRLGFIATAANKALGLIGAIKHSKYLWELHPLAVSP
jgi:hypothetical protein